MNFDARQALSEFLDNAAAPFDIHDLIGEPGVLRPADPDSQDAYEIISALGRDLRVLYTHVPPQASVPEAALILLDHSYIWSHPGAYPVFAVHVRLGHPSPNQYALDVHPTPSVELAQSWLAATRGVTPEQLTAQTELRHPADDVTRVIEDSVRRDGHRYEVVDFADYPHCQASWLILRDTARDSHRPYLAQIAAWDDGHAYCIRQWRFETEEAAATWITAYDAASLQRRLGTGSNGPSPAPPPPAPSSGPGRSR